MIDFIIGYWWLIILIIFVIVFAIAIVKSGRDDDDNDSRWKGFNWPDTSDGVFFDGDD